VSGAVTGARTAGHSSRISARRWRRPESPTSGSIDQQKQGRGVEAYGIEQIPTVVVERDGEELARFVERGPVPIAVYLVERIREQTES